MQRELIQIAASRRSRTIIAKLISFATIGVANVAVDFAVFSIAYQLFYLPLILSNVIAWAVAVSGSYAMNSKVTFGRETGGAFSWKHYLHFASSGVLGVVVATITLVVLSEYAEVYLAKFISILAAFAVNFSMAHFVVFRAVSTNTKPF
jgi:putative flippase GtrA